MYKTQISESKRLSRGSQVGFQNCKYMRSRINLLTSGRLSSIFVWRLHDGGPGVDEMFGSSVCPRCTPATQSTVLKSVFDSSLVPPFDFLLSPSNLLRWSFISVSRFHTRCSIFRSPPVSPFGLSIALLFIFFPLTFTLYLLLSPSTRLADWQESKKNISLEGFCSFDCFSFFLFSKEKIVTGWTICSFIGPGVWD